MITKNDIKLIKSLSSKKNRDKHQLFIVEGKKSVAELFQSDYEVYNVFATSEWINENSFVNAVKVTALELNRISNQRNPNEVLAIAKIRTPLKKYNNGVIVVLDDISDPGNMGTIIRMCDWFGVDSIVCSMNTVNCYNPKVVQSAMGSIFRLPIIYTNLLDYLMSINSPIYGAFIDGINVKNVTFPKNFHLVVGNESNGIKKEISDIISKKVKIKNIGKKTDSLNVAVATSILLHEIFN